MSERIKDVNIELGDDISRILYEASKLTYKNRPNVMMVNYHDSFAGFRAIPASILKDIDNIYMNLAFDGVGTKVEISERLDDHSVVAFDLFAMVCDDAVVRGAEPIAIGSILDVRQLNDTEHTKTAIKQLAEGYVAAAQAANVVVVNGEVAELGDRIGGYGDFNYNWGAGVLWVAHKQRALTGLEVQPGDALVGLAEQGFRSNGITDVRKAMIEHYGPEWQDTLVQTLGSISLGRQVQKPSTIYSGFVSELTGGFDIEQEPKAKVTAVAHITGGGQSSKLGRMLEPSGHGAWIDNPIDPPEIMLHVQKLRGFDDKTAYRKWHMGPGMVIATPEPEKVIAGAQLRGIAAKEIGVITDEPGIHIKNMGAQQEVEYISF
jgi:phosphoribosylformylglycinamidine cyclo-ligase